MSGKSKPPVRSPKASPRGPGRPRKHAKENPPERVAAYLPSGLARRLRHFAVDTREPVSTIVARAVEEFLARQRIGD